MAEVLTVLTFKSAHRIVGDGGTQSWVVAPHRARRCAYVVCVRHRQGPYRAEGDEPHKHAFLVGKVSGVAPSDETEGRLKVKISEYALINGPHIPLNSASPTQYFSSLRSIGIEEADLEWKSIVELPVEKNITTRLCLSEGENDIEDNKEDSGVVPMSIIAQAKKLISEGLQVPLSAIEIVVRV